jgi:hypothetical protein
MAPEYTQKVSGDNLSRGGEGLYYGQIELTWRAITSPNSKAPRQFEGVLMAPN